MSEPITLNKLEENLSFFRKMYDAVRIVDPVGKRVLESRGHWEACGICYDYWKNGKICDNCISVRSYHDNTSYMKLEQSADVIMLVTAVPVDAAGEPIVLELLKNATNSMMIGSGDYNSGQALHSLITNLNNIVIKDHLTSLYNRRFVDDRLPVDIVRATVASQPLSVIFLDIDNMKRINDTYGHATGDMALKEAAAVMQSCVRSDIDWVARYGGDEFIICLNNIGADDAERIAQRIHSNIAAIRLPVGEGFVGVSVSLGIQTTQDTWLTAEDMIRLADAKMYEAKRSAKK